MPTADNNNIEEFHSTTTDHTIVINAFITQNAWVCTAVVKDKHRALQKFVSNVYQISKAYVTHEPFDLIIIRQVHLNERRW